LAAPQAEPPARISDESLVKLLCQGDETAFNLVYERYFPRVFSFVNRRMRNRADAEEVVQEVFINVLSSVHSFRGEAPFAAWVFAVTRRTIAARFKKKRHTTVPLSEGDEENPAAGIGYTTSSHPTPLEIYEFQERLTCLGETANTQLSPDQRTLFRLHHLEKRSISEIALSLSKSEDAVKSNLYRTRKILLTR
jgi:RNA polymerase sigma-70 factor (ECF subfamily)